MTTSTAKLSAPTVLATLVRADGTVMQLMTMTEEDMAKAAADAPCEATGSGVGRDCDCDVWRGARTSIVLPACLTTYGRECTVCANATCAGRKRKASWHRCRGVQDRSRDRAHRAEGAGSP